MPCFKPSFCSQGISKALSATDATGMASHGCNKMTLWHGPADMTRIHLLKLHLNVRSRLCAQHCPPSQMIVSETSSPT